MSLGEIISIDVTLYSPQAVLMVTTTLSWLDSGTFEALLCRIGVCIHPYATTLTAGVPQRGPRGLYLLGHLLGIPAVHVHC